MTGYEAAVTAWARRFLGDDCAYNYGWSGGRPERTKGTPWVDRIDWTIPCDLVFDYEEPWEHSEYTGGGGTAEIKVIYPLLGGGIYTKVYADLDDLNRTDALPKLIAEILSEAPS